MSDDTTVPVFDAIRALAFVGDLSMGQPTDHSLRTAWLAARVAGAAGCTAPEAEAARQVALLRWSGCTANAQEVADAVGDDVQVRGAMLSATSTPMHQPDRIAPLPDEVLQMARISCEIAGDIAAMLGLDAGVELALRSVFEAYDGGGVPGLLRGAAIPLATGVVALASDLEIHSRVHGLEAALALVRGRSGGLYPHSLVEASLPLAPAWIADLVSPAEPWAGVAGDTAAMRRSVGLELVADVIDLKLAWMTGYSRRVAGLARQVAVRLGLDEPMRRRAYRAGLIHGIGRASVPNALWNAPGPLPASALERVRLVPYWTSRAAGRIEGLAAEAEIASYAFERRDGSGHFRGRAGAAMAPEAQAVAVAEQWVSHCTRRPGRPALTPAVAVDRLSADAAAGRFDHDFVTALLACVEPGAAPRIRAPANDAQALSQRELQVLRGISHGENTKEIARALGISPRTVRTHVERLFQKLGCSTRAAATLKAAALGWLQ